MKDDGKFRDRLLAVVQEYPGLHLREIARQMGTSVALVEYHVAILLDEGRMEVQRDGAYRRAYPPGGALTSNDRRALDALRRTAPLQVVLHLLKHGPQRHGDIAAALHVAPSSLSFQIDTLETAGVVERAPDGLVALRDAKRVRALLRRWKPIPDLRDRFSRLWSDLYGG